MEKRSGKLRRAMKTDKQSSMSDCQCRRSASRGRPNDPKGEKIKRLMVLSGNSNLARRRGKKKTILRGKDRQRNDLSISLVVPLETRREEMITMAIILGSYPRLGFPEAYRLETNTI